MFASPLDQSEKRQILSVKQTSVKPGWHVSRQMCDLFNKISKYPTNGHVWSRFLDMSTASSV